MLPLVDGRAARVAAVDLDVTRIRAGYPGGVLAQQRRLAQRGGTPLLDADAVPAHATSASGLVAQLVFWCGQASFFLVLALYMQLGRGMSALSAGLVFTIMAVSYLATSMPAPTLTERMAAAS